MCPCLARGSKALVEQLSNNARVQIQPLLARVFIHVDAYSYLLLTNRLCALKLTLAIQHRRCLEKNIDLPYELALCQLADGNFYCTSIGIGYPH